MPLSPQSQEEEMFELYPKNLNHTWYTREAAQWWIDNCADKDLKYLVKQLPPGKGEKQ